MTEGSTHSPPTRLARLKRLLSEELDARSTRGQLIRATLGASSIRAISLLIALAASVLYARTLGPRGYGIYAYVISFSTLLAIPASLGIPGYLLRELAYQSDAQARLVRWGDRCLALAGVAAALLMLAMALIPQAGEARWLFVIAAPLPLLTNLAALRQSWVQVQGRTASSLWPSQILAPCLVLVVLGSTLALGTTPTAWMLCMATVLGAVLALVAGQWQMKGLHETTTATTADATHRLGSAFSFMWLGMLFLINSRTDLLMLGAMRGATDAGVYAVASRAAELVAFFLITSNMVLAPRFAQMHADGDCVRLQRLLTASSRRVVAITLPVAVVVLVLATPLLRGVYGQVYVAGATALQILVIGQVVNVLVGPAATLLNMAGKTRLTMIGLAVSAGVNIALNALLIPDSGPTGAAIATAASLALWNAMLWVFTRRQLSLSPGILPR